MKTLNVKSLSFQLKRHNDDIKTTDLLIRLYEKVLNKLNYESKTRNYPKRYENSSIGNDILITINDTLETLNIFLTNLTVYMMLYYLVAKILMLN